METHKDYWFKRMIRNSCRVKPYSTKHEIDLPKNNVFQIFWCYLLSYKMWRCIAMVLNGWSLLYSKQNLQWRGDEGLYKRRSHRWSKGLKMHSTAVRVWLPWIKVAKKQDLVQRACACMSKLHFSPGLADYDMVSKKKRSLPLKGTVLWTSLQR